ncbi:MAG: hypothetical protein KDC38_14800, partial [Planctomycetes bacterium]|nr:hypothetical protein [Planctomycetota bacterium]
VSGVSCDSQVTGVECSVTVVTDVVFLRGDANDDMSTNVADTVFILAWIFTEGEDPHCFDAMDGNDDGMIDIADPIYLLAYFFSGGSTPPSPFGVAGPDPTADSLTCESSAVAGG